MVLAFCHTKVMYRHYLDQLKQDKFKKVWAGKSSKICIQFVYFSYYLIKKIIFECNKCIIEPLKHLKMTAKMFVKYFQNYSIALIFLSPVKQNFRRSSVFETCTFSSNYSQSFSSKCRVKYFRMNIADILTIEKRKSSRLSQSLMGKLLNPKFGG